MYSDYWLSNVLSLENINNFSIFLVKTVMTGIITEMKTLITKLCKEMIYENGFGMKMEVIKLLGIPIYKHIKETDGFVIQSDGTVIRTEPFLL